MKKLKAEALFLFCVFFFFCCCCFFVADLDQVMYLKIFCQGSARRKGSAHPVNQMFSLLPAFFSVVVPAAVRDLRRGTLRAREVIHNGISGHGRLALLQEQTIYMLV